MTHVEYAAAMLKPRAWEECYCGERHETGGQGLPTHLVKFILERSGCENVAEVIREAKRAQGQVQALPS